MSMINSRKVMVFRSPSFINRAQGKDVSSFLSNSKQYIGAYFESRGSTKIATGLTREEIELLMPTLIDAVPSDKDFLVKLREYFNDINTEVPYDKSLEWEIGLESSNDSPLSASNMPLNVDNYIRWRHARKHPQVALSKAEAASNSQKLFYIFDRTASDRKKADEQLKKDQALQIYMSVKEEDKTLTMMLSALGIKTKEFSIYTDAKIRSSKKKEKLKSIVDETPELVIAAHGNKHLETVALLNSFLEAEIIKKSGKMYIDVETQEMLANNEEEMVFYLEDAENSQIKATLMARLQLQIK